jgi:hypothetical protein
VADNSFEKYMTLPWEKFVKWLGAPADAEATRLGITDPNERNAFGHAYTAALIAHGYLGMPITRGRPADAADLVDVLGRAKEDLPGIFGRQTDFRDYYRDLWNNGVGADIGNYAKAHLYSRGELGKLVKDAIDDGTVLSSLTDTRIPAQPSGGYLSWPVSSPPQYQGPPVNNDPNPQEYSGENSDNSQASVFDTGAPPVRCLSSRTVPSPGRQGPFDSRFGNWETSGATPQTGRPLGLFTGEPMPDWLASPPIFDFSDRPGALGNGSGSDRESQGSIPFLEEYIRYLSRANDT